MNWKTLLVIASLTLSAGLTSCKSGEAEAPKTTDTATPAAVDTKPADGKTDVKPVEGKDVKPMDGKDVKPAAEGKTDAKPADGKDVKPADEKKGGAMKSDGMKPDATKKDEKKPN